MSCVQEFLPGWSCGTCGAPSIVECRDYKVCAYLRLGQFEQLVEVRADLLDMERLRRDLGESDAELGSDEAK